MGNASVFDAFAAAAGFSNTMLGIADKVNKEKARSELQSVNNLMYERNALFKQNLQGRTDFENWDSLYEEHIEKLTNDIQRSVTSPFAAREAQAMMDSAYAQEKVQLQMYKVSAEKEWVTVNDQKNIEFNKKVYKGQKLIDENQSIYAAERAANIIDEKTYVSKSILDVQDALLKDYKDIGFNLISGSDSLNTALEAIEKSNLGYSLNLINSSIADPNSVKEGSAYKVDYTQLIDEKAVKEKAKEEITLYYNTKIKAIQDQNEQTLSGDLYIPALMAMSSGDLSTAMDYITKGKVFLLEKNGNNIDAVVRDKYGKLFTDMEKTFTDDPDKAKGLAFESMLLDSREAFIRMGKNGDFDTLSIAKEAFQDYAYEQVTQKGYKGTKDKFEYEYYSILDSFIDEAVKILEMDTSTKVYMNGIKEYEKQLEEKIEKDFPEEAAGLKTFLSGKVFDLVMQTNWKDTNVEVINKKLENTIAGLYSKNLDVVRKSPTGESGFMRRLGQSEESLLAQAVEILQSEDIAYTDASGREVWPKGVEEGRAPAIKAMQSHIAQLLDVDISQVNTNQEVTSETRDLKGNPIYNDISGNTIFTVGKDHYKFTTTDGKNITLLKKTGSGEWTETENLYQKTKAVKKEIKADIKEIKTTQEQSAKQKEQAGILSNKTDVEKERVFSETLYTGDKTRNQYWRKSAEAEWNSTGKKEFEATLTAAETIANAPAPNGIDQGTWNSMNSEDKKAWFYENPSAYDDWKTRIENLKKNDRKVTGGR